MVTGQTHNLWKLKDLGGIVTKENVVREGPGRYGSEVYHGTSHLPGTKRGNNKKETAFLFYFIICFVSRCRAPRAQQRSHTEEARSHIERRSCIHTPGSRRHASSERPMGCAGQE